MRVRLQYLLGVFGLRILTESDRIGIEDLFRGVFGCQMDGI